MWYKTNLNRISFFYFMKHNRKFFIFAGFFLVFSNFSLFEIFGQNTEIPDISASVSGTINCINPWVKLAGSSKNHGVSYQWSGPNGYTTTQQNPVTTIPGDYTLKVTDHITGGVATATIKVEVDTIAPKGVKAEVTGLLTCKDTLATLVGTSSTSGVTYKWTGPESFRSMKKRPETRYPGFYLLEVTNPLNGCRTQASLRVKQNIIPPSNVTATASGILTCHSDTVELSGSSATDGVNYSWVGPDFTSVLSKPRVSKPGTYLLTVTDPLNGCKTASKILVKLDITPPSDVTAETSGALTCKTKRVTIKASSPSNNVNYDWRGPNNLVSTEASLMVNLPGTYKVTVTNQVNGCSVTKPLIVQQDTTPPLGVNVTSSGDITCVNRSVTLEGSSLTTGVTYNWSGPDNFSSSSATPEVSSPRTYRVTVTNPVNGCSTEKSITVNQNMIPPEKVMATVSGTLSCDQPKVTLNASSSTKGVLFNWNGPKGFTSAKKNPVTFSPGNYKLTATNPVNGCNSATDIVVTGIECSKNKN